MAEFIRGSSDSSSNSDSEDESDSNLTIRPGPWWRNMIPKAEVPEAFKAGNGSKGPRNALSSGNFWEHNKQGTLRKMALDCAKAGYVHKLHQMLVEHDAALLLLPASSSQVGPQQTLIAAAQASGNPQVVELVEEAATAMLFSQLRLLGNGWGEGTSDAGNFVTRCLQAGADPSRPLGSQGVRPLQHLCQLTMDGLGASHTAQLVQRQVAQAANQLAEASPMVLILAFDQGGSPMIPLEAAAKNPDFGAELVPILSSALEKLLLRSPALAAAPLVLQAAAEALRRCPGNATVERLMSLLQKAQPCLDGAVQNSNRNKSIWEPYCAYEDWLLRERRLQMLQPLVAQLDQADSECQKEEALQRLAEVQGLLKKRRRQHSEQIAELQMALDKAQRAAEEASARANEAMRSSAMKASAVSSKRTEPTASAPGDATLADGGDASPSELLQRIRQQRGLDIDYSGLPKSVAQSALAMQRSIGAAVERLAVDLYASRGHFLLELIQNADDNRYKPGDDPQLSLHLDCAQDGSLFFASVNNELGMNSKDVEALCDINRSTKPTQEGKIGKKGVGWKAVFAVSDQPTVLSGPFRFSFDVRRRGRLGYVTPDELSLADFQALPQLLQEASANTVQPATVLYLPLRGGPPTEDGSACDSAGDGGVGAAALIQSSMERLLRCPTWLLFLRQLRRVAWQDAKDSSRPQNIVVERRNQSLFKRSWSNGSSVGSAETEEIAYFVHRKIAVVPRDVLPLGVEEGSRKEEVVVAFRKCAVAQKAADSSASDSDADPVFCFLPVRPVGFRFSLHAPWALTSNREDFHLEDPRNVWLRGVAAAALAEAIGAFGQQPHDGSNLLTLLDGRRVLEPFWRRLLEEAVNYLGDAPVVPVMGEPQLYRPSEVLVPPQSLVRCPGAMKFLHSLPASLWPVATGKRLARVGGEGISEEVAEEDSRRLLSLRAEALTARRIKSLLNSGPVGEEIRASCQSKGSMLIPLLELLNAFLSAAAQPEEGQGCERLADVVEHIQQMKVIPVDFGFGSVPMMSSLAEGDVFLPGGQGASAISGSWCPGMSEGLASALLAHKGIRVFDSSAWKVLPMSSQGLFKQLGVREATLSEVAAAVVRVHAFQLDEALQVPDFSGTFVKLGSASKNGEEAEIKVLWAGLEAICLAHEACRDDSGKPVPETRIKPDPALCGSPSVGWSKNTRLNFVSTSCGSAAVRFLPGPSTSGLKMTAEALGRVLWLPARSEDGELLLRRAPALLRRSFLGVAAEPPLRRSRMALQEMAPTSSPLSDRSSESLVVEMPPTSGPSAKEQQLRWEVFLADLKAVQPSLETLELPVLAERLVSRDFWEVIAKSADFRRHVCRIFRENDGWLSDLEVPNGIGPGRRIASYFRRGAFEPIVGEAGLPYVDAPEICQPYLEMLRIRCVVDFENLAVALSCWADKDPPPMCAPKALMHALLREALRERQKPSVLMDLKKKVFIPGKGPVDAQQAVWSLGQGDNDFVRNVCKLADAPILEEIYGETLRGWFCDFLNVRESPGVFQLLEALSRILPAQAGGKQEGPKIKPTLSLLRQIYAELFLQLQQGFRASEDATQLERFSEYTTLAELASPRNPLAASLKEIFQSRRFIVLPQARGRPWKFLTSAQTYWSVDDEIADLPCSKFALSSWYASPVKPPCRSGGVDADLKKFFVEVLGVTETLTREELARRFQPRTRPAGSVQAHQPHREARDDDDLDISSSEDGDAEDDANLGLQDLLGEDGLLEILPAFGSQASGSGAKRRRVENVPADADVDATSLRNLVSRCTQRTRSAQAGEAMYAGGGSGVSTTTQEVALRKVCWSHRGVSLYACGPPSFLASPEALGGEGLSLAGRQASLPRGSIVPSQGLQQKVAAFADSVLIPLAQFFEVPVASLATAVGPGIGRGRNVHGLICFNLPQHEVRRSDLCRWYCEMCRLLASNAGEEFSAAEVASALTAQHMTRFLQFQASMRRRR